MDARLTTIIVMVAAAVFVFWGMLYPKFTEMQKMRDEIKNQEQEKVKVRSGVEDINEKIAAYEQLSSQDLEFLDKALPKNVDLANLYVHINSMLVSSGLSVRDIGIEEGAPANSGGEGEASESESAVESSSELSYHIVPISISATGSYESFKEFVLKTENTLRIMDVRSSSFVADGGSSVSSFSFEIGAAVYYKP